MKLCCPYIEQSPTTDSERLLRAIFPGPVLKLPHRVLHAAYGTIGEDREDGLRSRMLCPFQDALTRLEQKPRIRFTKGKANQ